MRRMVRAPGWASPDLPGADQVHHPRSARALTVIYPTMCNV